MWIVFALLSALFVATTDPIAKRLLRYSDEYMIGWLLLAASTPFLSVFYLSGNAVLFKEGLLKTLLFVVPFEVAASILYYRALRLTDISLSVPFLALTPVCAILTGYIFLGETIRPSGIIGIVFITIGVYSLNLKEAKYGFVYPIKALFLNKGSLYMALVAVLFSVTAVVCKRVMFFLTPESTPFIYNSAITIAMAPIILYRVRKGSSGIALNKGTLAGILAMGLFSALAGIFYFKSIAIANVAYAISIKRLSLLISVGYGWIFFRERDIHIRLFSTFCMFIGVVLVLIG